ncbi:MAG: hypothetical protein JWN80_1749, partial [Microbacteriaceae bacterium]|nr:hypothetical protein [Microbacteriaceae bacterium]
GAWLLARRALGFSAEAVGALGVVFVVLDVWAFAQSAPAAVSDWVFAAFGTLVCAGVLLALSALARVRCWLWFGLVGVSITPTLFAFAVGDRWVMIAGEVLAGFVSLALQPVAGRLVGRVGGSVKPYSVTATVLQLIVVVVVALQLIVMGVSGTQPALAGAALLALSVLAVLGARHELPRFWSFSAGALFSAAATVFALALPVGAAWFLVLAPLAGGLALVLLGLLGNRGPVRSLRHDILLAGGWTTTLVATAPAVAFALFGWATAAARVVDAADGLSALLGLAAAAIAGLVVATLRHSRVIGVFAAWLAVAAAICLTTWSALPPWAQVLAGIVVALVLVVLVRQPWRPTPSNAYLSQAAVGAHVALFFAAVIAWANPSITIVGNTLVIVAFVAVAFTVPPRWRTIHAAVGYAYALVIFAIALARADVDTVAVLCLTTSLASLCALAATLIRRLPARFWYAVLAVTAIPFAIAVVSVLVERSGWTALSTAVTFALALTLTLTSRPGLNRVVRSLAAAILVPSLAVVIVCLGAQVLVISASPVTLPVIAAIVAATLPSMGGIQSALGRRGVPAADATAARLWIEISSLLTGALAVLIALLRSAAGLDTTLEVLVILGFGSMFGALLAKRRYLWVVAGACWSGALWSFWAILGITVVEPYVVPPAVAATVVAAILVLRGRRVTVLYWLGLACAIVPSLVIFAVVGGVWRPVGLLVAAALLVVAGVVFRSRGADSAAAKLRAPTLVFAMVAAAAGAVQAVRFGFVLDASGVTDTHLLVLPALGLSALAALVAAGAAFVLNSRQSRWSYVPAVLYLVVGPITAVRHSWLSVLVLGALAAALLALMIVTTLRARTRAVTLPPVWVLFVVAWCAAVAAWSPRMLRVEVFSLPLGLALLAVGAIVLLRPSEQEAGRGPTSWPIGFSGSWQLLAPGILVTLVPSILSTGTDPLTWRAILVIALALAVILIGSLRRLASPFILGIIVLPIENAVVFIVQIGRTIGANPWWITLATAGAVLLVIAVTYERRAANGRSAGSRLRDLT